MTQEIINAPQSWQLRIDDDQIAWLTLNRVDSSMNSLSHAVLDELREKLAETEHRRATALVIASAKIDSFIVGADIHEFTKLAGKDEALVAINKAHRTMDLLAGMKIPTLAMINGHCLGGGAELALACRYRVAVEHARFGFPEVLLGIHPGFGGTVRSIRRAGVLSAMDLMLSGRRVPARVARTMGLIDEVVAGRHLLGAVKQILEKQPAGKRLHIWQTVLEHRFLRPWVARILRAQVAKKARPNHYPAPYALIDLWQNHADDAAGMLRQEAESVAGLISGATAQNLVRVYLLQEHLKSLAKIRARGNAPAIRCVHVIGAGVMGGDIAAWCCLQGLAVSVQDINQSALAAMVQRAHALFRKKLRDPRRIQNVMDRLLADQSGKALQRADVVIEAVSENLPLKQKIFTDLEKRVRVDTVLATNTSSIPLEQIAQVMQQPQRLIGIHFFNPVAKMQLVEVVSNSAADDVVLQRGMSFVKQIKRLPLPVKSVPGFLVNRVLTPYVLEAALLVEEGQSPEAIDAAALQFGMPMGPVELADTVGLDISQSVAENLGYTVPATVHRRVQDGNLGRKTGRGFYTWRKGKPKKDKYEESVPSRMVDRLVLRYLNEVVACLRERVSDGGKNIDAGLIFATGFAPFTGGPLHYIEQTGKEGLLQKLEALTAAHGERFTPDEYWGEL